PFQPSAFLPVLRFRNLARFRVHHPDNLAAVQNLELRDLRLIAAAYLRDLSLLLIGHRLVDDARVGVLLRKALHRELVRGLETVVRHCVSVMRRACGTILGPMMKAAWIAAALLFSSLTTTPAGPGPCGTGNGLHWGAIRPIGSVGGIEFL